VNAGELGAYLALSLGDLDALASFLSGPTPAGTTTQRKTTDYRALGAFRRG